jgi:tetratricopeptide (TPR) repeat protein
MSTLKPTRKISRRHELREDSVITASSRLLDVAKGNQNLVTIGAIGVIALIAAFFGFRYYQGQQEVKAAEAVASAVQAYEDGRYQEALSGVAGSLGLTGVINQYGSTPTGNLARFYAADAQYRLGEFDEALTNFQKYDKSRDYLGASAYAGEAAIMSTRGEHARAAELYVRAAEVFESDLTSPQYLLDAAGAYESAGNFSKATQVLERIKEDYPSSAAARDTDLVLARVNAKASES